MSYVCQSDIQRALSSFDGYLYDLHDVDAIINCEHPMSKESHSRSPVKITAGRTRSNSASTVPWRERPYQQLAAASDIAGVSEAALYKAEKDGLLTFARLSGRTLVETSSLIAFIGHAEPWTPSDRGDAARAKRAEIARAALR